MRPPCLVEAALGLRGIFLLRRDNMGEGALAGSGHAVVMQWSCSGHAVVASWQRGGDANGDVADKPWRCGGDQSGNRSVGGPGRYLPPPRGSVRSSSQRLTNLHDSGR